MYIYINKSVCTCVYVCIHQTKLCWYVSVTIAALGGVRMLTTHNSVGDSTCTPFVNVWTENMETYHLYKN